MRTRSLTVLTWLVVAALYLGVGTFDHDVWAPAEPTTAGLAWSMWSTGDLAVPRINAEYPFLDTPPLYLWLVTLSGRVLGGLSPGALRFPAVVLGIICLGVVFWIARRAYGTRVACVAVLLAALCGMFWDSAHRAGTDIAGTAFAFVAFGLFARSLDAARDTEEARWDAALAIVLAASFYAKNLFTAFVALPVIVVFLIGRARFARVGRLAWIGLVAGLVLALPWVWGLYEAGGWEYVRVALVDNTIGRLLPLEGVRPEGLDPINDAWITEKEPAYFYVLPVLTYPLPWTPLVLVGLLRLYQRPARRTELQSFLALGFVAVPLVLSLSSSKAIDYVAPILFFAFALIADFLAEWFEAPEQIPAWQRGVVVANVALVTLVAAGAPLVLGAILARPLPIALGAAGLLAAGWLLRRSAEERLAWSWLGRSAFLSAAAAFVFLVYGVPALDREKSFRPFFDGIAPALEGRVVATTFRDAYRLPLITYYLDRRLPVIQKGDAVLILLEGSVPFGAIVDAAHYQELRTRLDEVPGTFVLQEGGGGRYFFVANSAADRAGELKPHSPVDRPRTRLARTR